METNANQKVSCMVNYVYEASEPDELSIRPGDVLRDVERLSGGWWRGELRGRKGMFPDNFVSVITDSSNARGAGAPGRCRAVFSYQPANPDELPLSVGDVIDVLGEVEEGWWQGKRQGRVGVFPSNFVVMLDPPASTTPVDPAPALPPKPVKELCRVLFPYTAVNEDEITLSEGDVVTIVSKEAPDRGWWRGELHGRVGLFPDNFVQMLPSVPPSVVEERKPDRPASKTPATTGIYPVLNKYSEKTSSVKELTTSKISTHKENAKETSIQTSVTNSSKSESEKLIHSESGADGPDGQIKKPPVPVKKSPTPTSGVGGLFSGLKNKMLSSSEKEKSLSTTVSSSGSSSSGEWDRIDGGASSKQATNSSNTFDHIERNTLLSDPRAGRVKAPRRRPPSQALRDDTPQQIGLSNGHEAPTEKPPPIPAEKTSVSAAAAAEEIKPRLWEKQAAPWMAELKLNQAKKTSFHDTRAKSVSGPDPAVSKAHGGSTDRILDVGLEEKRSTHSMEMSKSTSSISSRMSVAETIEETTKVRHSMETRKETSPAARDFGNKESEASKHTPILNSPTAAGRTLTAMLDEIKKPVAPPPPLASVRTSAEIRDPILLDKSPNKSPNKSERASVEREKELSTNVISSSIVNRISGSLFERTSTIDRTEKTEEKSERNERSASGSLERRAGDALVAQLNNRISNLEKLIEVQNTMFKTAIEELTSKLKQESEKRQSLQSEVEKLAHCVTQV